MTIEKLEELLNAATPGLWEDNVNAALSRDGKECYFGRGPYRIEDRDLAIKDARLIATLRNLAPELLAVVRAAQKHVKVYNDNEQYYLEVQTLDNIEDTLLALRIKIKEVLGA